VPRLEPAGNCVLRTSLYVANSRTARANLANNPCGRWHQKHASADDLNGTLAFQRLRRSLFTPGIKPDFKLHRDDKIFAIGSCFARGIEQALVGRKMQVLSAAPEFASLKPVNKDVTGLGFTNKYNTFSIYNELRWALEPEAQFPRGSIVDVENGLVVDPHINPTLPLAGPAETWRRRELIQIVNGRAAQCRVIFITLGLVEVWRDIETDTSLNSTPFFNLLELYPERYEVHVTDFAQNLGNLERIHELLSRFGHPDLQIVVTVSPVPLMATFSEQDVVLANTYSKSLLRTVAQHWSAAHGNVHYFPSYEIVQNSDRSQSWEADLRHVKPQVVKHIMDAFVRCYLS
jgi:GSCFA family